MSKIFKGLRTTGFSERLMNLLAGATVLSWAYLGMRDTWLQTGGLTVVRTSITAMHLLAGYLFFTRSPLKADAPLRDIGQALPGMLAGGCAFRFAPPTHGWPWWAEVMFVAGTLWAATSLLALGRSFAILPALRDVVIRGPYQWMRHPAYLGELAIGLSCWLAGRSLPAGMAFLALIPATVWRIIAEERTLRKSEVYGNYANQVPWRLIPGIW